MSSVALVDARGVTHALSTAAASFADVLADGTTIGQVTAFFTLGTNGSGTISYTYTLTDNINRSSAEVNWSFTVAVTDSDATNPDTATGSLVIAITDDGPIAKDDSDVVAVGQTSADGNVITGAGFSYHHG